MKQAPNKPEKEFHISVMAKGISVSTGGETYSYDNIDDALEDIKNDLASDTEPQADDGEDTEAAQMRKKLTRPQKTEDQ